MMLHNFYQQPGGEDECFAAEAALLESKGHEVERVVLHNDSVSELGMATVAAKTIWNAEACRDLRRRMRDNPPDVLHAHNLFPLFSPAVLRAAKAEGVPVVQTMHNYRLSCVNAIFFRSDKPCEDCQGRTLPWPGVLHRCYRGSALLSGGVASMIATHRLLRTWSHHVDVMIALTEFARAKLVASGIPAAKIALKPNFLAIDPGAGPSTRERYALFVGRVTPEKGVATLIRAWAHVPGPLGLKIVGDGPFAAEAARLAAGDSRIEFLGRRPSCETLELMRGALAVVVPSEW
ncbi:glycosyltransferase [Dankookia sp. P2]|uniref:glycosyltransferase n=1 Tax=Dankookia sp. P2 TaxID=3423955 RepID=UPI003D66CA9C